MTINIFWFGRDLRLADNPMLHEALGAAERTALVYVLEEGIGGASKWWLHHSLQKLSADIAKRGGNLLLRHGDGQRVVAELARQLKAEKIFRNGPGVLFPPERISTQAGGAYGVFTPFSRACFNQPPPGEPIPAPKKLSEVAARSDRLEDWKLLPTRPDWAGGLREAWTPGEAGAKARLKVFVEDILAGYGTSRDVPGVDGTSRLSPHLHFGEISPRTIWHAAGEETYLRELIWRDFAHYLLKHHPDMPSVPMRKEFAEFPWKKDEKALAAWQQGRTGVPIVDAGMRQLWRTGWMHNRVRMICASFLVKHLLVPWQEGEAWFWDTLVDADLANNSMNWQWVAGCGADAAPFFRIFNPVLQGKKFDPRGDYVREFVPELRGVPDKFVHSPWEAGGPAPIVDLAGGRERALAAFKRLTKKG